MLVTPPVTHSRTLLHPPCCVQSTSTDSSIGCKNQTVLYPNGTVVAVASTVVAMELGAGNVTYGQSACNDDYVNVQNADYASSLVALNTVDALSSANLTYVFSSAAQASSASTIIYGVHATPVATTTATSSGVIISWIQGMPQIGPIATSAFPPRAPPPPHTHTPPLLTSSWRARSPLLSLALRHPAQHEHPRRLQRHRHRGQRVLRPE